MSESKISNKQKLVAAAGVFTVGALAAYYYFYIHKSGEDVEESSEEGGEGIGTKIPTVDITDPFYQWCHDIPKIELHAHLNGSIRQETLLDFINQDPKKFTAAEKRIVKKGRNKTIKEVWKLFGIIHRCITTKERLKRITREMIEDYEAENVKYLEIRTTPKPLPEDGLNEEGYILAVLEELADNARRPDLDITTNLILSINRSKSIQKARATVDYCVQHRKRVKGLDFSGPRGEKFEKFLDVFEDARDRGVFTSIHCGEWEDTEDLDQVLAFQPDRIGHFVHFTPEQFETVVSKKIPVEICASSNLISGLDSIENHPFGKYDHNTHPLAICADDRGIFNINLTHEYYMLAKTYDLSKEQMKNLIMESINHTFQKKKQQRRTIKTFKKNFGDLEKKEARLIESEI